MPLKKQLYNQVRNCKEWLNSFLHKKARIYYAGYQ